jgi:predicted short-subunit dehydrogenase-like oxidoreductase (DUF2520 family)
VGVVGAGKVGAVLGAALRRAGHDIVAVSGVSDASLERAAELLPRVPVADVPTVIDEAELVVLAVPDDALEDLVAGLATTGAWRRGQLVIHTSGRHGLGVYGPALMSGIMPMAVHPVMTFTGTAMDLPRLHDACFGVTAPDDLRPVAEALVIEMGADPVWVPEESRALYHTALAHGSNHLVTLVAQAMQLLEAAGVQQPDRVLGPLLQAALDNALRLGDAALTGPVARGDAGTVAEHLTQLRRLDGDIPPTYIALARATAERALASGRLKSSSAEPLLEILAPDQEPPE